MKTNALIFALTLLCGSVVAQSIDKPAFTEVDAVRSIASGMCGTLDLGTGLVGGKGWLHQPIPGPVTIRTMSAAGTIQTIDMRSRGIAPKHLITIDMYAGRPHYVMVQYAMSKDALEWKVPGYAWGPVPLGFQLPPK